MAIISYSNLPTQKTIPSLISALLITFFILLLAREVNSSKAISFNFTKFTSGNPSIILQGDARISSSAGTLELTSRRASINNIGRALYATPIPLWDESTGNLASFITAFSFVVRDIAGAEPADGIVFFLAPEDSRIPPNSGGGAFGIIEINTTFNRVVAVEFDSFINEKVPDPDYVHVGINVNTLASLKTVKWERESGKLVKVNIIYDSLAKSLSVVVTYPNGKISTISQVIDLKQVLPEKVRVGFGAATTGSRQTHDVHSWSFTSTLETTTSGIKDNANIASYA